MGCAMGTICSPPYVNLFMTQFEEKHIYPYIKDMTLLYLRYINDIFIIWNGTKEQLITFINELNKKHKTIKFEYKISSQKIQFLDIWYTKTEKIILRQPYTGNTSNLIFMLNQNTPVH